MGTMIGLWHPVFDGYILAVSIGGSLLPDIDLVHGGPGTIGYLEKHRTYTHSIFLAPILSILLSSIVYGISFPLKVLFGFNPSGSFLALWLWCLLAVLSHLLVDILNSFGTMIWWRPYKEDRVAKDILFEFDPVFTIILFAGSIIMIIDLIYPHAFKLERSHTAIITACLLMGYIFFRAWSRKDFKNKATDRYRGILDKIWSISIVPAGLWRWKAILEGEEAHYIIRQKSKKFSCEEKPKTPIPREMDCKEVGIYKNYARHLDVQVNENNLILHNLVYSPKVLPFYGSFHDVNNPSIKIEKPNWLKVLFKYPY